MRKFIRENEFDRCDFMRSPITLPDLTEIEEKAFYECQNLETADISETVTKIDPNAFVIILPDGLTEIGEYAFNDCQF